MPALDTQTVTLRSAVQAANQEHLARYHREAELWQETALRFSSLFNTTIILLSGGGMTALVSVFGAELVDPFTGSGLKWLFASFAASAVLAILTIGCSYMSAAAYVLSMRLQPNAANEYERKDEAGWKSLSDIMTKLAFGAGSIAGVTLAGALMYSAFLVATAGSLLD